MLEQISVIDRFRGVMVGSAAGDALGAPLEFGPPRLKENLLREMIGGGAFSWKPGEWTDDTQMALCISKSLRQCKTVDLNDIARRFVTWFESRPPDVGLHTGSALRLIRSGVSWEVASARAQAQNPDSAGNGSLMRTAPLALFAASSEASQIVAWSRSVSRVTHAHDDCQWSCAALNVAIVHLLRGGTQESALDAAIAACADGSRDVCERLSRARLLKNTTSPSGHVLATLEVAFWSLLNTDTFEDAVVEVVNRGDDSDTVGAVTGALAGAYYGVGAIPSRWMQTLMRCSDLVRYADDLHRLAVPDVPEFEYACIVPDRVYIGRNPLSRDDVERLVRESGITHVLDLREPWEFSAPRQGEEALASLNEHGVRRLHIPVQDMQAPTHADIGAAVSYIEETLANPAARLYLHCRAGKERSGCVAVAWYAQKHGIEYDETLSRLQKARPSIWPLPGQELAIRAWLNRRFQHNSAVSGIMDNATTVTVLPLTCNTSDSEDKIMSTLQGPDQDVPETIEFQHSAVILYVGRLLHGKDASDISAVYRAARYAWRVDCKRAAQHELVLAVVRGVVKGVFANIHWMQATEENFPGFEPKLPKKWGFTADNAADDIARLYIGKRLPASMTKRGAAFPVKYAERELGQICRGL